MSDDDWHPSNARDILEVLIAETRNALIPTLMNTTKRDAAISRVLDFTNICVRKLQRLPLIP